MCIASAVNFASEPAEKFLFISEEKGAKLLLATTLKDAQIENDDALALIKRLDGPDRLFYVDPPYMFDTRHSNEKYYKFEMTDNQHVELAELLNKVEGMVILSGYDHPMYQELYSDWTFLSKEARTNGQNNSTECLWINPSANELNKLPLFQTIESDSQ